MKKTILITILCASLMLVTPFTTVAQENTVSNNLTEQTDIGGLVDQIRTVIDKILEDYRHIPIITKQCGTILNLLDSVGYMIICILLIMLIIPVFILHTVLLLLGLEYLRQYIMAIAFGVGMLMVKYCPPLYKSISKLPYQSIYTLSETKDYINTFDGCPCLQE